MKIALLSSPMLRCPPQTYGGLEQIVWDLVCGLTELGHKVLLFAPKGSQVPPKGFLIETPEPALSVKTDWLQAEKGMYEVYKEYLKDFDGIIHGHGWFGFEYILKQEFPNLKVCHTHHGGLNWKSKPPGIEKLNLVAISDWMVKIYESRGFAAKRAYNGVNLDRYPFKAEKGDRLLYVGRFSTFKQPHVAIEVAKRLDMGIDLLGGTFVDDVAYLNSIRELVAGYPKATMYEDASHEKKLELMQNAKALIFPSAMSEPFGLVAIEALACGTSVIASNDGAIPELVTPDAGIVCNTVQAPALVEQMVEAVKKIDKINPEACRARAEVFSRENMAKRYLELYRMVISDAE